MKSVIINNLRQFKILLLISCCQWLMYMPLLAENTGISANPPFSGTIWIAPKTIESTDKSSFKTISDKATVESSVEIYDREAASGAGAFIKVDVWAFDVTYTDNITMKVRVRKSDYSESEAKTLANQYAFMMGQLPGCLRKGVEFVNLMKGDREWGGNGSTKALDIQIGTVSEDYQSRGILEETLVHEACHAALDYTYAAAAGWKAAQQKDPAFISTYARDYPDREDIAETFLMFLTAEYRSNRVDKTLLNKITSNVPNRLKYFESLNLNLSPFAETVMDIDGNVYKTVEIGNQTWMAENLRVTSCNDGSPIAEVKDQSIWVTKTTPAYSWGDFTTVEKKKQYGAFYNAYVAQQACNVCPNGWHVPSQPEYQQFLDGQMPNAQVKLNDPVMWPNGTVADNASGWSAVPAGGLGGDVPGAYDFNRYAYFWSTSPRSAGGVYLFVIHAQDAGALGVASHKYGFSIRCIKNQ